MELNPSSLTSSESLYDAHVKPLDATYVACQSEHAGTENFTLLYREEVDFTYNSNTKEKAIHDRISNLIFKHIRMPERWQNEGVNPPNIGAKKIAEEICINLYDEYDLIAERIAPSIEEGIFIYYKNPDNHRALIIEAYNNFEIAALVTDESGKGNLYSENIKNRSFTSIVEKLTKD